MASTLIRGGHFLLRTRRRQERPPFTGRTATPEAPAALIEAAGTERVLLYDVPPEDRPLRTNLTSPFVSGGQTWWEFIRRRHNLDTGDPCIVVSLRPLEEAEALIVIDWGTMYANALFLVEPVQTLPSLQPSLVESVAHVRASFGSWHSWHLTAGERLVANHERFSLNREASLVEFFKRRLPEVFPPESFREALLRLNEREPDLFHGREVRRVIVPFLTRLGMPVPYAPEILFSAVRDLVNLGMAWVEDPGDRAVLYHGPEQPVPQKMSLEEFAAMRRV
jgi:hypothetical protein